MAEIARKIKTSPWRAQIDAWILEGCSAKEIHTRLGVNNVSDISQRTISRYMKERQEQIEEVVSQKVTEFTDLDILRQVDEAAYLQLVVQRAHDRLTDDVSIKPSISQAIQAASILSQIKSRSRDPGEARLLFSGEIVQRIIAGAVQGTLAAARRETLSTPLSDLVIDGESRDVTPVEQPRLLEDGRIATIKEEEIEHE